MYCKSGVEVELNWWFHGLRPEERVARLNSGCEGCRIANS